MTPRVRRKLLPAVPLVLIGCLNSTDAPTPTIWETHLVADAAHPGVSGQAAAVTDPGGTSVSILIEHAQPGAVHAWGVYVGSCAAEGARIGPATDYPGLAVSGVGSATVDTHLGPRLTPDGEYYVRVSVSATDTSRVACGDFVAR